MILSFVLSRFARKAVAFRWSPSLDLSDHAVFSNLIPGTQF